MCMHVCSMYRCALIHACAMCVCMCVYDVSVYADVKLGVMKPAMRFEASALARSSAPLDLVEF